MQMLEQAVKQNSTAEIRDANGNILETLEVDVQVQQLGSSRSADGVEYKITCMARSTNNDPYTDDDSKDGYVAVLTMVCKDVFGTENLLISVSGNFSGGTSATDNRKVKYAAYNVYDVETSSISKAVTDTYFMETPSDYTGFTFRAWSSARIVQTGNYLSMYVSTNGS